MNLSNLVTHAADKTNFQSLSDYINFSRTYLDFASTGLQAVIVSQNENIYQFYQYGEDGHFNITRPLNSRLMYKAEDISKITEDFPKALDNIRDIPEEDTERRYLIIRSIYTMQQCIGAALDALKAGKSNTARKVAGDLFERLIRIILQHLGIRCKTGTVKVPVRVNDSVRFDMSFQHDLLLYDEDQLKAIGSVKISSKDRVDKIFMDKFMYCKLTDTYLPHIAIFLNDVQRKQTKKENEYGISTTFLPGHFKGFTVKLNPLDGVYYCDIRPNMQSDSILKENIRTIDHLLCSDVWDLLGR